MCFSALQIKLFDFIDLVSHITHVAVGDVYDFSLDFQRRV